MSDGFTQTEVAPGHKSRQLGCFLLRCVLGLALGLPLSGSDALAQEQLLFPAIHDAQDVILQKINAEQVRIDISMWILGDRALTQALVNRHLQGLPIRVIGDRAGIFEADPNTRREFEFLASSGIPIRLRYHPTWFPEIIHWKAGIFVGQNVVEFGSANWTAFELQPFSATDFKDEAVMFTNDPALVNAFRTTFDRYWVDTTYFLDWPEAYQLETGQTWTTAMNIPRGRLEPDYSTNVPGMIWGQGPELNARLIAEINRETAGIDYVSYRTTMPEITNALIARHRAGVPVRVFAEPTQYRNPGYPEYWLVGAEIDRLLVAGVPVKQRLHAGLTHMKSLVTSTVALVASSNFTRFWQRDHNYFISATTKPQLHFQFKQRLNDMWDDSANYADFQPQPPWASNLVSPGSGWVDVPVQPRLEWARAPFAVAYDVYLGPANGNLAFVGRVNAVLDESPPQTYSFTPSQPLQPSTMYQWRIVSRTFATEIHSNLTAASDLRLFTTGGSGGGGGSGPYGGVPVSLPGLIQVENFDEGASGVAYFDTTPGNDGGQHRLTDVDIEATGDAGGGFNVGWSRPGEWLKYSVNVAAAGSYTLQFRVASPSGGGVFHVEIDGIDRTGPLVVPNTGGWQSWATVTEDAVLAAGPQEWRLVLDSAPGSVGNFNYIRVVPLGGGGGPDSTPYGGTPVSLPGTIQAENFDEGGSGFAYVDTSSGNTGGQYRTTDVDVGVASDTGGGYRLGWIDAGEWLNYTVNVATAGAYDIEVRVASNGPGGTFHIEVGGVDKTGPMTVPNTGGWQAWTTIRRNSVTLAAGQQVWRLVIDGLGASGAVGNINWIRVVPSGGGGEPPPAGSTPFRGTPIALPGQIEAEDFDAGGAEVAYRDQSGGNIGGAYRSTDVDIGAATDTGGGFRLGWIDPDEWLQYTVNVAAAGTHTIDVRVASNGAGGTFHIEVNGVDKTGPMTITNSGGWQAWRTIRKTGVTLGAGPQVWRLVMDSVGTTGAVGNINWIRVTRTQ